jgi:hypothetical protein
MRPDFSSLLPRSKMDIEKAEAIIALGYPAVEPILPALVEWIQDMNWPVAQVLQPFLVRIGPPLAPHLRRVLKTDDDVWKYWLVCCIVAESSELAQLLRPELQRLVSSPTKGEQAEEINLLARGILESAR